MPIVVIVIAVLGMLMVAVKKNMDMFTARTNDLLGYPFRESPNRASRNGAKVTTLVWHYTAGVTASSAIAWLTNQAAKASAHFVIGRSGDVTQLVKLSDAAWHAGNAGVNNASSIGVELVNPGRVEPDGKGGWTIDAAGARVAWRPDETPEECTLRWPSGRTVTGWWVPYTAAQIRAARELVERLKTTPYGIVTSDQRGHEDIATPEGRKTDPGPLFPWSLIAGDDKYAAWQRHVTTKVA